MLCYTMLSHAPPYHATWLLTSNLLSRINHFFHFFSFGTKQTWFLSLAGVIKSFSNAGGTRGFLKPKV